eukprot:Colp12_sorted_trinity150504_noHs@12036
MEVSGFKVLATRLSGDAQETPLHYMFLKKHSSKRDADVPQDRTLFVANLPLGCTIESLKAIFSAFGTVEEVFINEVKLDQKELGEDEATITALVIFEQAKQLNRALSGATFRDDMQLNIKPIAGVKKWMQAYKASHPPVAVLQKKVDTAIANFEAAEEEAKQDLLSKHNKPDEDGWVTVQRGGKRNRNTDGSVTVYAAKREEADGVVEKKKKKEKELLNFYRFQQRQQRRDEIANLRQQFEEDKKKIAAMRQARKFRPY